MSIFANLKKFLEGAGIGGLQPNYGQGSANGLRTMEQIRSAPFKMYEDGSFQGAPPQDLRGQYRFYEDNSFAPINYAQKMPQVSFPQVNPMGFTGSSIQEPYQGLQNTGPVMDWDSIPNNYTAGRTGYYQGSNPYLNNLDYYSRLRVR